MFSSSHNISYILTKLQWGMIYEDEDINLKFYVNFWKKFQRIYTIKGQLDIWKTKFICFLQAQPKIT